MNSKYTAAGVNISLGDKCSQIAYEAAKRTFVSRKNGIGSPVIEDEGFTGMMDFGDFYLVQNNDTVGSKAKIADLLKKYDTLGYDLLAMVADDAVCVGAEVVSISNTIEISKVNEETVRQMMNGLEKACLEQKIIIPGGEIAEMGNLIDGVLWDATAVGILAKDKVINGLKIKEGDILIGLKSPGLRSNGFSLVRHVLKEKFGDNWFREPYYDQQSWGEAVLTPSKIYHNAILEIIGRYKEPRKIEIKGLAHITGGGIPGNLRRILKKKNFGADLFSLPIPEKPILKLQDLHTVRDPEAYRAWNMGIGMIAIVDPSDADKTMTLLGKNDVESMIIGNVIKDPVIKLKSQGYFENGKELIFS